MLIYKNESDDNDNNDNKTSTKTITTTKYRQQPHIQLRPVVVLYTAYIYRCLQQFIWKNMGMYNVFSLKEMGICNVFSLTEMGICNAFSLKRWVLAMFSLEKRREITILSL